MPQMGVVRAEGQAASSVLGTDKFVVQRYGGVNAPYYSPYEATVDEVVTYANAGHKVIAAGTATLVAGTVTVAMAGITAASIVHVSEASATPNALGYTINAGVSLVITSASNVDVSKVSYIVLG